MPHCNIIEVAERYRLHLSRLPKANTRLDYGKRLSIEALAKPSFSQADNYEFPAGGGQLAITAPTGYGTVKVYYNMTTDGTTPADPTNASTEYTGAITINADTKIKAIAYDGITASPSAVESASYTIAVAKIKVTANAATTMSLDGGTTSINIPNGESEITIGDINTAMNENYNSLDEATFASLSFGDKTKIVKFDGGGMKVTSLEESFHDASNLTSVKGIIVDKGSMKNAFNGTTSLTELSLSGDVTGSDMTTAFMRAGKNQTGVEVKFDLSGLEGKPSAMASAFNNSPVSEIDMRGIDTTSCSTIASMFEQNKKIVKLTIGNMNDVNPLNSGMFLYGQNTLTTLVCKFQTPPTLKSSNSWLKQLADNHSNFATIVVPYGCLGDANDSTKYAGADVWKDYSSKMVEESN